MNFLDLLLTTCGEKQGRLTSSLNGLPEPLISESVADDFLAIKTGFSQKVMKRLLLVYLCATQLSCVAKNSED
jgi:hypothetical protein